MGFAKNLRSALFAKVQDFSFGNVDHFSTSSLVTRLTTDVNHVQMSFLMLIRGAVRPIRDVIPNDFKVPHIGWNALSFGTQKHALFRYLKAGDYVYFVHSYYATECAESVIASTDYGAPLTAAVASGNVMGTQFHPEKSGEVGLSILRAFCEM
jgi:imidazole glycerol phosphate synthase glutamine amidotransferase subunit